MAFELFEHTADLGLRIRAPSFAELLAEAARALTATLIARPDTVQASVQAELHVVGDEPAYLLVDWLGELLYRFGSHGWLAAPDAIEILSVSLADNQGLRARIGCQAYDPGRHGPAQELKAVTYHGLHVAEDVSSGGWLAEVVIDL